MDKVVQLFDTLRRKIGYLSPQQIEKIHQAYHVAEMAHRGQKRYTGEPYITHPVAVAGILADMRMDDQSIMAALLHDVIEDTPVEKQTLIDQFGKEVAELVDGVSKLTQIEFSTRAEAQAENFRKMLLAMARDIRVILVKLADRLHNMRTLHLLPPEKRHRIARETLDIFAPIANRLGMYDVCLELQELGFHALYPLRYRVLKNTMIEMRGARNEMMASVQDTLQKGLERAGLVHFAIMGREKHFYSIYKKMRDKHLSFSNITDVYAFRIIVDTVDTCYRVLGVVHSLFKPVPERFKDYIAIPKANGYQSLHTTLFGPFGLPIEIQIRTQEMDQTANNGIAAHWLYKSGDKLFTEKSQVRAQQWVKNLLEIQQRAGSSLEFIENVKIDLFPDEVYIFTPKGKIMELPAGATAVDFAYSVHTDIGNTCVAVKIDRQLAPLSTVLKSGETVEIITALGARPNPAWLDFVVTGKARSGIRHFLKSQQRSESVALGKKLLDKSLLMYGWTLKQVPDETVQLFLREINIPSLNDLLEEMGLGNRIAALVADRLKTLMGHEQAKGYKKEKKPLEIKGTEGMVVTYATCCYPIPGDPIVGLLTAGRGILVHMEQCKKLTKMRQHAELFIPVRWAEEVQGDFMVGVIIDIINERGVLAAIAFAMAETDANIDEVIVKERDGRHYQVSMKLLVKDRAHLARVMRQVRKVRAVLKIARDKS